MDLLQEILNLFKKLEKKYQKKLDTLTLGNEEDEIENIIIDFL